MRASSLYGVVITAGIGYRYGYVKIVGVLQPGALGLCNL